MLRMVWNPYYKSVWSDNLKRLFDVEHDRAEDVFDLRIGQDFEGMRILTWISIGVLQSLENDRVYYEPPV